VFWPHLAMKIVMVTDGEFLANAQHRHSFQQVTEIFQV